MRALLLLGVLLVLLATVSGETQTAFVDPAIDDALQTNDQVRVMVILKDDPAPLTDEKKANIQEAEQNVIDDLAQQADIGIAEAGTQGVIEHQLSTAPIIGATLDADAIDTLASHPDVEAVYLAKPYQIDLAVSVPTTKAPTVWGEQVNGINVTGAGQTICVIDTGIDTTHGAFTGKIVDQHCYCFGGCCQGADESSNATDDNGHGTHVASIAMGNGGGVIGVAKDANVLPVKVCDSGGSCDGLDMAVGIDYCINQSSTYNISVITMSISDGSAYATQADCPTDFGEILGLVTANNMLITVASGNEFSTSGIGAPSCDPNATSVGASNRAGSSIASYSNRGPLLDVVAPGGITGDLVVAALLGGGTTGKQGTSMATPHAAGVAALLAQNAQLHGQPFNPFVVEQILKDTASNVAGYRLVNSIAALVKQNSNYTYNTTNNSLSNPSVGTVFFRNSSINTSRLGDCFNISLNRITMSDTNANCTQYNGTATVRLQGLSFHDAKPLVNGVPCASPTCQNRTYGNGMLTFDVLHFSSYAAGSAMNLSIFDDTDNESRFTNDQAFFFANFTNSTGAANTTTGACKIAFNTTGSWSSFKNMTYNLTGHDVFGYNRSFSDDFGNSSFNVTCASFNETISTTDAFLIQNDTLPPTVTLESPANNSLLTESTNVSFAYDVADNSTMANCSLTLQSTFNASDVTVAKGISQTFNITLTEGTYSWNVTCFDVGGNSNTSTTQQFTLNLTIPHLLTPIPNQSWTKGTDHLNAFDLDDYFADGDNATLLYSRNGTSSITVTINDTTHVVSFNQSSMFTGTEYVTFNASDGTNDSLSNAVKLTVSNTFSGSSGGGGGGGGGCADLCTRAGITCAGYAVKECGDFNGDGCLETRLVSCPFGQWCQLPSGCVPMPCTEEWYCDDWSACEQGTQTRKCVEANACGTEDLKPDLTQPCAETSAPVETPPVEVVTVPPKQPWYAQTAVRIGAGALLVLGLLAYTVEHALSKKRKR
ncbi:MAG TPA: S8 family serine peptidase [Candidatus Binatia bacterium]|nr:S8 family serine peptidase [Candidatus Binatia bacterium]